MGLYHNGGGTFIGYGKLSFPLTYMLHYVTWQFIHYLCGVE